jgi:hypothetical protein
MLKLKSLLTPSALLTAFILAAAPGIAQERYHGRENSSGQQPSGQPSGGQQSSGQSRERAQPRGEAPRAQTESQRPQRNGAPAVESRQETPRAQQPQQRQQQQQQPQRQAEQPRADVRGNQNRGNDNRATDNRRSDNRGYDNRSYQNRGNDNRGYESGRAVPRGNVYAPRYEPRYSPRYSPRGYGYYGSRSYSRPYVFRPRFSIGFGIFAGYPVPYSYSYPYPIMVYGYRAPRERVMVSPGSPYYGGIALEMTPYDADVFVDGTYAGRVEDFDGATQPLTLTAGVHEIEVQAQGYEPMRINVEVQPGQVIPYRGDLRPY